MTMRLCVGCSRSDLLACLRQTLMVVLINIPTISFGLAMGWVSLATGEGAGAGGAGAGGAGAGGAGAGGAGAGGAGAGGEAHMVAAAAVTFCASLAGMPLCARALAAGRKRAVIVSSALFVVCWALKLCGGGWWVVAARACAGLAGAAAWALAPIIAREMCSAGVRGAAVSALVLANNLGMLLMYVAALLQLSHRTVLWSCLTLSAVHCVVFMFVPESPQYLAAQGRTDKARESLAWLRGVSPEDPSLLVELAEFSAKQPQHQQHQAPLALFKDMLSEPGRRLAFVLSCVMVLGQEVSGVMALLQYAERVFVLARDSVAPPPTTPGPNSSYPSAPGARSGAELGRPAGHAVLLGTAQLVASALALYLIEKIGRKKLMVVCGAVTGLSLAAGGIILYCGVGGAWAAGALALAVFADSAGLEPAPYAMAADMFDYQYRSCAMMLMEALTWLGNAVEVALFPVLVAHAGLSATLALSGTITLVLIGVVHWAMPETRGRSTRDIYDDILRRTGRTAPADIVTKL